MTKQERELCKRLTSGMLALPKESQQYIIGYADGAAAVQHAMAKEVTKDGKDQGIRK